MSQGAFRLLMGVVALAWAALWLWQPAGPYNADEAIQIAAMRAMLDGHGFVIENGHALFKSRDLLLWYLIPTPAGTVSQYPSGYTFVALPFYAAAGIRGVFLLHLLAGGGVLWASFCMAALLTDVRTARLAVALLAGASFLVDYTVAIWPHMPATFLGMLAALAAVRIGTGTTVRPFATALLGGLAAGAALNLRLDILFLMPALALWVIFYARNLAPALAGAVMGLVPGLALASSLNLAKFGQLSPVSYGRSDGSGTDPERYMMLTAALLFVFALALLARWRPGWRCGVAAVVSLMLATALALRSELRGAAADLMRGFLVLIVDLRLHRAVDIDPRLVSLPDGRVFFYGVHKKALVQSLPWLGVLPLLALVDRRLRPALWLCGLVVVLQILPFAARQWHGGSSANLRYLLPILPFLALLAALALGTLPVQPRRVSVGVAALALVVAGLGLQFHLTAPNLASHLIAHVIPLWVAAALAVASSLAVVRPQVSAAVFPLVAAAVGLAAFSAYRLDLDRQATRRAHGLTLAAAYAKLPAHTLVYTDSVQAGLDILARPEMYLAAGRTPDGRFDLGLIAAAARAGLNLAVDRPDLLGAIAKDVPGYAYEPWLDGPERGTVQLLVPR